jgi:DNA-binding FadR family transcriptional regulator
MEQTTLGAIRTWLAGAGALAFGGRLPPERELAGRFGVNRGAVRKALAVLEAEGHIRRYVGRGTFLTEGHALVEGETHHRRDIAAIANLTSPPEAMQARLILEPEVARLAALNATSAHIAELRQLAGRIRAVHSWSEYEDLDWRFHDLIAEASGNKLLVEMQLLVNGVRRAVVWGYLARRPAGPPNDYHSFAEHDAIVEAIADRDRRGAAAAMRRHLDSTAAALRDEPA